MGFWSKDYDGLRHGDLLSTMGDNVAGYEPAKVDVFPQEAKVGHRLHFRLLRRGAHCLTG